MTRGSGRNLGSWIARRRIALRVIWLLKSSDAVWRKNWTLLCLTPGITTDDGEVVGKTIFKNMHTVLSQVGR